MLGEPCPAADLQSMVEQVVGEGAYGEPGPSAAGGIHGALGSAELFDQRDKRWGLRVEHPRPFHLLVVFFQTRQEAVFRYQLQVAFQTIVVVSKRAVEEYFLVRDHLLEQIPPEKGLLSYLVLCQQRQIVPVAREPVGLALRTLAMTLDVDQGRLLLESSQR